MGSIISSFTISIWSSRSRSSSSASRPLFAPNCQVSKASLSGKTRLAGLDAFLAMVGLAPAEVLAGASAAEVAEEVSDEIEIAAQQLGQLKEVESKSD